MKASKLKKWLITEQKWGVGGGKKWARKTGVGYQNRQRNLGHLN